MLRFKTADGVLTEIEIEVTTPAEPGRPTRARIRIARDGEVVDPGFWDGGQVIDSSANLSEDIWEEIDLVISSHLGE